MRFDCSGVMDEPDKRFAFFATQVLPPVLKSAVQSAQTAIFVPSSFDFIRVQNYFRKQGLSFSVLSEYSSGPDISRARQAFYVGKKAFLLVSERFHFYHRSVLAFVYVQPRLTKRNVATNSAVSATSFSMARRITRTSTPSSSHSRSSSPMSSLRT
jgi:hypothetical protein